MFFSGSEIGLLRGDETFDLDRELPALLTVTALHQRHFVDHGGDDFWNLQGNDVTDPHFLDVAQRDGGGRQLGFDLDFGILELLAQHYDPALVG